MKKILSILVVAAMTLSLTACSGNNESITGTYKNITFLADATITLNENETYDRTSPNEKGTYTTKRGGFVLTPSTVSEGGTFAQYDDHYYYTVGETQCFSKDKEYGIAPTFDENGKSNQSFDAFYHSISDNQWDVIYLTLNEDGTFSLRDCTRTMNTQTDGTLYEGTYTLEGEVLSLDCGDIVMPFLYLDDKIYFNVFEKQNSTAESH